jgi:hypothetical protein
MVQIKDEKTLSLFMPTLIDKGWRDQDPQKRNRPKSSMDLELGSTFLLSLVNLSTKFAARAKSMCKAEKNGDSI